MALSGGGWLQKVFFKLNASPEDPSIILDRSVQSSIVLVLLSGTIPFHLYLKVVLNPKKMIVDSNQQTGIIVLIVTIHSFVHRVQIIDLSMGITLNNECCGEKWLLSLIVNQPHARHTNCSSSIPLDIIVYALISSVLGRDVIRPHQNRTHPLGAPNSSYKSLATL
jgi:hypothetical protein